MSDENLIVGPETLDDAGVYRLDRDTALVQTLDFFPPVVDDPVWFGRIAAANALSDVFAMGGRALTAMNIVCFPATLPTEILGRMLKGGAEKILEAGAILVGGHSIRDTEVKYGLAVTGLVHPDRLISNANARDGDLLVLTKPLGMGAVTGAIKGQKLPADLIEQACEQMAALNRAAAEAAVAACATAMTDITGFGLMGHARGMAAASSVTFEIVAADLPLFPTALDLAGRKFISGAVVRNRVYLESEVEVGSLVPEPLWQLAFDAETSGGLLIAVPAQAAADLCADLRARKVPCAAVVGRVTSFQDPLRVRLV